MPIAVPAELAPLLEAADRSVGAIDEFALPGQLAAAIAPERELTSEERKGALPLTHASVVTMPTALMSC